ncbi:MAG: DUF892 family protein, partial [Xanthobacteraceae bacterium]
MLWQLLRQHRRIGAGTPRPASPSRGNLTLMRHMRRDRNSAPAAALSHIHTNANTPEQTMSAKEKTLEDLFYETLKDIYFAEKQILKALPKMAKAVNSDDL